MRLVFAATLSGIAAGCTLLVSTNDLADGPRTAVDGGALVDAPPVGPDPGEREAGAEAGLAPTSGLLGAWLFDDETARDSSPAKRDGTFTGDARVTDTERGKAMVVGGFGGFEVPSLENLAFPKDGTLSVWCSWSSMDVPRDFNVFDTWETGRDHVFIRKPNDGQPGQMQVALQAADGKYRFVSGFAMTQNAWSHLVLSWSESERRAQLVVDGAVVTVESFSEFSPADQRVRFGTNWRGYIDDIRLYDRVLSDAEIAALP